MLVLWIDNAAHNYRSVWRIARQSAIELESVPSIRAGIERLEDRARDCPNAVILDAILPLGGLKMDGEGKSKECWKYTGVLVLNKFPELRERTLILSVVGAEVLEKCGFPSAGQVAGYFRKAELPTRLGAFGDKLKSTVERFRLR